MEEKDLLWNAFFSVYEEPDINGYDEEVLYRRLELNGKDIMKASVQDIKEFGDLAFHQGQIEQLKETIEILKQGELIAVDDLVVKQHDYLFEQREVLQTKLKSLESKH